MRASARPDLRIRFQHQVTSAVDYKRVVVAESRVDLRRVGWSG